MAEDKETVLEDWAIVAYISLRPGLDIKPFKQSNGRVAFRVQGDIEPAVAEIYANTKVPICDYIKALKATRNAIFTLRGIGNAGAGVD